MALSSDVPTQFVGLPGDPGGNARLLSGQVNAPFTEPTCPKPRQLNVHWLRSMSGRSRPNANNRGLMPNVEMGIGAAANALNFQGS